VEISVSISMAPSVAIASVTVVHAPNLTTLADLAMRAPRADEPALAVDLRAEAGIAIDADERDRLGANPQLHDARRGVAVAP
jgi:hypothetical protein